tara:strand:- start:2073 stop:2270 length:198 start_codon:yes stop_codon:yes gene_type:complete
LAIAEEPPAWGLELAKKRLGRFRKGSKNLLNRQVSLAKEKDKGSQKKLNPSGGLRKANKTFAKGI